MLWKNEPTIERQLISVSTGYVATQCQRLQHRTQFPVYVMVGHSVKKDKELIIQECAGLLIMAYSLDALGNFLTQKHRSWATLRHHQHNTPSLKSICI